MNSTTASSRNNGKDSGRVKLSDDDFHDVPPHSIANEEAVIGAAVLRGEHAKTGLEQVVDIGPDTTAAIKRVLESRDWLEPVVFRYPWATRKLWLDFHSILTAAGLSSGKYVGFHRIRKTHATQQVIAVGWEQARVALGHSSESITRCYVDVRQLPRQPLLIPRPSIR